MLSKPQIFYDSGSEVIKGQAIKVSCQSENGTSPISYRLLKANNILETRILASNEPAVFKDNPTNDTEYQCFVKNCHSHTEMESKRLKVKVIGELPCYEKKSCGTGAFSSHFQRFGLVQGLCGQGSGWYLCKVHKHDMWQSRTKAQQKGGQKISGGYRCVLSVQNLSSAVLKYESSVSTSGSFNVLLGSLSICSFLDELAVIPEICRPEAPLPFFFFPLAFKLLFKCNDP